MKIVITNGRIRKALEKGGAAAFTKEATDDDNLKISPTLNCVRLVPTEEGLTLESHVSQMSVKHSIPAGADLTVEDSQPICFDVGWVLRSCCMTAPDDRNLVLETGELPNGIPEKEEGQVVANGSVTVSVQDQQERTLSSWDDRTFSADDFSETSYAEGEHFATVKASLMKKLIDDVIFTADLSDYMEMLDNLALSKIGGRLMLCCTDGKRFIIRKAPEGSVQLSEGDITCLVKADLLKRAVSVFEDDDEIRIHDGGDGLSMLFLSENTSARIAMPPAHARQKFPDVKKVLDLPMEFSFTVARSSLIEGLGYASKINRERGEYVLVSGEQSFSIKSSNEGSTKKNESTVFTAEPVPQSVAGDHIYLSSGPFLEFAKRIVGDTVKLSITPDERRVKVEDTEDSDYVYYLQRMKPPTLTPEEG
jgi:DNA polymerase III sliding clamp (beta) subunit (PCNA family)